MPENQEETVMQNKLSERALRGLIHPIGLVMLIILVLNDTLLKPYFPSWLSGKLSDLALVYLLPFIILAVLGLLPRRIQGQWIKWLAFTIPLLFFGLGKTIPQINQVIYQAMQAILPFATHFVHDPSDALALFNLPLAFWVWQQTAQPSRSLQRSLQWRWVILPLTALLTLADAAAPQHGVSCLEARSDGTLLTTTEYYNVAFISQDGGVNWQSAAEDQRIEKECTMQYNDPGEIIDFDSGSGFMLRFTVGEMVQESRDGGVTWEPVLTLRQMSQAEQAYQQQQQSTIEFVPGPLDIVADPVSGNVVIAMGHEGILLRKANAEWAWVTVGEYGPKAGLQEIGLGAAFSLLWIEWLMAVFAGIFLVSLYNLQLRRRWWRVVKVVLGLLGWFLVLLLSPAISGGYLLPIIVVIAIPVAAFWALFCLVDDILSWVKQPTPAWRLTLPPAILAALGQILIYSLWVMNLIKDYAGAFLLVVIVTLIFAISGTIWVRARRPMEDEKHEYPRMDK